MNVESTLDNENESLLKVSANNYFAVPLNSVVDNTGKAKIVFSQNI